MRPAQTGNADGAFSSGDRRQALSLRFDARLDAVEGILALVQDWADREGVARDDGLSLRLVLDELLANICMHADSGEAENMVDLRLELLPAHAGDEGRNGPPDAGSRAPQGMARITLRDAGKPFNPLSYEPEPVTDIANTPVGGRGITLVRLLTARSEYQWTGGGNQLGLDLPLAGKAAKARLFPSEFELPGSGGSAMDRLRALWSGNLALRQTAVFTLCAIVLIWGAMALYMLEVENVRAKNAFASAMHAMRSQSVISSDFVDRAAGEVERVARNARLLPDARRFADFPDELIRELQKDASLRSLAAEVPVAGIVAGRGGKSWLYHMKDGELHGEPLEKDLSPLVSQGGAKPRWRSLFMRFAKDDPHAAMLFGVPLATSGRPEDGWIGAVIVMPWIAKTLQALGGFAHSMPFFVNHDGRYVIYPAGRKMGEGPQSLSDEAQKYAAPGLMELEKKILAGEKGVTQLRPLFHGDATPWPLPWDGPTSLAYHPMRDPGWHLALLISSEELGDAPLALPGAFYLMAILGPLCIGCVTWLVTSRTLRPLHDLASSLERIARGDLDAPVPKARFADEIGLMLATFESVRATLRASFRNLVNGAAAQQRIRNELALARNIQTSMLPDVFPQPGWAAVHASIDICHEVCGDLYDCFVPDPAQPSKICCVIGDVCGKGIPAAIIMSRAMSLARAFLLAGLAPGETLSRINDALLRRDNSSMFVTMLVGILEADGTFRWASAGHPPPILGPEPADGGFSPGRTPLKPWPGELVLGVRGGRRYAEFALLLAPGQSLLLRTDGADEAQGPPLEGAGELYGEKRLADSFDRACREAGRLAGHAAPESIVARLREDIEKHRNGRPLEDDMSLMAVTRLRQGGA